MQRVESAAQGFFSQPPTPERICSRSYAYNSQFLCHLSIKAPGPDVFSLIQPFQADCFTAPSPPAFSSTCLFILLLWHPLSVCRHYSLSVAIIPKAFVWLVLRQWEQSVALPPTSSSVCAPLSHLCTVSFKEWLGLGFNSVCADVGQENAQLAWNKSHWTV